MTDAPINDDCYIVIVTGDEENKPQLDVIGKTVNESLSEEDKQSPEVASINKAKKVTIRKVEASSEQGNRFNDGEKQTIITLKENGLLLAEISKKSDKSPPTCNVDIKDDYKVFLTEDITDKNEDGLNGPGFDDSRSYRYGFYDDGIADMVVLNDKDVPFQEEYVLFDKENYSSDDNIPLEINKAKKPRKMKEKANKSAKLVKKLKNPKFGRRKKALLNDDIFTITDLTFEEQIADIVKRQESSNYKNSVYKCTACYKGFLNEDAYNSHMLRHTDEISPPTCSVDIKDDYKVFLTEDITDKNDGGLNGPGFDNSGSYEDGIADMVVLNDKDVPFQEEYVLFDKENYFLDDSIPLETDKAKKPRKMKEKADKSAKLVKKLKNPKIDRRKKALLNDDIFTITDLTFEEQTAEIVKRQESSNYKNSVFKCTACYKGFLNEDAYNSHMLRHTDDESPPTCNVDIKDDDKVFLKEDITDKNNDGLNGLGFDESGSYDCGFYDDGIADMVVLNDKDVPFQEEYVLFDKENYFLDDSIPLETDKAKKPRKMKEKADKSAKLVKKIKNPKIDRRKKALLNDDIFTITDLTFEEQIAEIVKRQESSNYKNAVFKCPACYKGFLNEDAYNSHMLRHTDQYGDLECAICMKHFKHSHALKNHMITFHTQKFSCKQCTFVTNHKQTATFHARWHKGIKYKCPHCPDEFEQFTSYMTHLRIRHPSDFVCGFCGYSFVSAKGLNQHKNLKHRIENVQISEDGPLCELCNLRFVSSEALQRHLSVSARHNTDNCSRELNQCKRDRKHQRRARDMNGDIVRRRQKVEDPIPCEQCGVKVEGSWAYYTHFRRMHPDKNRTNYPSIKSPCMCEVCGRLFTSRTHLKEHTWTHRSDSPFRCDSCGKVFISKHNLMLHQRTHSQERPTFKCVLCGKNFSNHGNRTRHMLTHASERPYKCEICGKGFKVPGEKQAHVNFVHLKKPWPKRNKEKRRSETGQVER